jgi:RNA polymerase sigma-70 factor, ECF subfamily
MTDNSIRADEDQRLAFSIKQRNGESFSILYDKYAPALLGIIKKIVNNEKLADEILKSTFVKVWNQAASFNDSKSSLFTWLINLARQTAVEEIKPAPEKNLLNDNYLYEEKTNGMSNGQNKQSAFDLIYYAGLSCTEAAAKLHITVAELKTNIRMKIKKLL